MKHSTLAYTLLFLVAGCSTPPKARKRPQMPPPLPVVASRRASPESNRETLRPEPKPVTIELTNRLTKIWFSTDLVRWERSCEWSLSPGATLTLTFWPTNTLYYKIERSR